MLRAFLLIAVAAQANSADGRITSVLIRNSEVYVFRSGDESLVRVTGNGLAKSSATVSKAGTKVAFLQESKGSLADIVILSADGAELRTIHFRPDPDVAGMRFVERLEWITDLQLAASGSLNPSTVEYVVLDSATGREGKTYLADGFNWSASPDGTHVAYLGYTPHFTPVEDRRPQFCIDDECQFGKPSKGYPDFKRHIEFNGDPVWASDGSAVAMTGEIYETKAPVVVVRPLRGKSVEFFPPDKGDFPRISWDGKTLVVNGHWRLEPR